MAKRLNNNNNNNKERDFGKSYVSSWVSLPVRDNGSRSGDCVRHHHVPWAWNFPVHSYGLVEELEWGVQLVRLTSLCKNGETILASYLGRPGAFVLRPLPCSETGSASKHRFQ